MNKEDLAARSSARLRLIVGRTRQRAFIATCLVALTMSCNARNEATKADECLEWRGVRYCFPTKDLVGIATSPDRVSANIRIPLAAPELRHCNAAVSNLDRLIYNYDNVDVRIASVSERVLPAQLYNQQLAFYLGVRAPALGSAGSPRCGRNKPETVQGVTCLEREAGDGQVYVTTCTPSNGVGNPGCSDHQISALFEVVINSDRACYPVRGSMRRRVQQYFKAHETEDRR